MTELIAEFTRKGTGLTVIGKLVTSQWQDRETGNTKSTTKVQVQRLTLAPKAPVVEQKPIEPQASLAGDVQPASLWGGQTGSDEGLPELPMPI